MTSRMREVCEHCAFQWHSVHAQLRHFFFVHFFCSGDSGVQLVTSAMLLRHVPVFA